MSCTCLVLLIDHTGQGGCELVEHFQNIAFDLDRLWISVPFALLILGVLTLREPDFKFGGYVEDPCDTVVVAGGIVKWCLLCQ